MKPDAQRIAIARACNFPPFRNGLGWILLPSPLAEEVGCEGTACYTDNLNAMHEAISMLASDGAWTRFLAELENALNCAGQPSTTYQMMMINASAEKRAEAFLRAIGKWEDSA